MSCDGGARFFIGGWRGVVRILCGHGAVRCCGFGTVGFNNLMPPQVEPVGCENGQLGARDYWWEELLLIFLNTFIVSLKTLICDETT
jgi:hypothetical protein